MGAGGDGGRVLGGGRLGAHWTEWSWEDGETLAAGPEKLWKLPTWLAMLDCALERALGRAVVPEQGCQWGQRCPERKTT